MPLKLLYLLMLQTCLLVGCSTATQTPAPIENVGSPEDVRAEFEATQQRERDTRQLDTSVTPRNREQAGAAYREAGLVNTLYNGHYGAGGGDSWVEVNELATIGVEHPSEAVEGGFPDGDEDTARRKTVSPAKGKARNVYGY